MKILFYQRSDVVNSSGGTEMVLCLLSSKLAEDGYKVTFMTNEKKIGKPFFYLSKKVNFINIGGTSFNGFKKFIFKIIKSTPLLKLLKYFDNYKYTSDIVHKNIENIKPDLIILASPADLLELCYSNTYKAPIIQMIHGVPWNIFHRKSKRVLKETLKLMSNVSICQVLMPSFIGMMKQYYNGKVIAIPNIVPSVNDTFTPEYSNKKKEMTIVNIARITSSKNQMLILDAFAKIANKYPNWNVKIWGRGNNKYKDDIHIAIKKYGLENRFLLIGETRDPLIELKNSDIFAFPTLFEGFGMAMCEAMTVGLPCIGLSGVPAVSEIIENEKNGILTENNPNSYAEALEKLINNVELRKKLGQNAKKSMKNYSAEKVMGMWKTTIKELINENS